MKQHGGIRPQDPYILLKLIALRHDTWRLQDLSSSLQVSLSEVSESLNRSRIARLLEPGKRRVYPGAFEEFLIHGLKYVFPIEPGALTRGLPTAHAGPPLNVRISQGKELFVWPDAEGTVLGQALTPLHRGVPYACRLDPALYELLALTDAVRLGGARQVSLAAAELGKRIKAYADTKS